MRLELATFKVTDIRFSDSSRLDDGVLFVDREALRALLLPDDAFEDVAIEIVRPGDQARVIHVMDVAEPRTKIGEEGSTFPGFVGPRTAVGQGRTHRLAGMAVVAAGEAVAGEPTYWREAIVDMAGPGAEAGPFGATVNLVLSFKPRARYLDPSQPEAGSGHTQFGSDLAQQYNHSVRVAELKAAAYLAGLTAGKGPDSVQVYELTPVAADLPRVVYFFQIDGTALYGEHAWAMLPNLLHPNEVLDGALVHLISNTHAAYRYATYFNQNHAIIRELYARHGSELDFAGVIVYARGALDLENKTLTAEHAVKLAQMLGARGACSSYLGGGQAVVEFMDICQRCERAGITTVQVMPESYGTPDEPGFLYFVPEAVGIVSTGRCTETLRLPAMPRVIGGASLFDVDGPPEGSLEVTYRHLLGSCTSTGYGRFTASQW